MYFVYTLSLAPWLKYILLFVSSSGVCIQIFVQFDFDIRVSGGSRLAYFAVSNLHFFSLLVFNN